jgi:hypothetical protein
MVAELRLDDKMTPGLRKASGSLGNFAKRAGLSSRNLQTLTTNMVRLGAVAGAAIGGAVYSGIQSLAELEDANTATAAALEASGLAAKVTAKQIRDLSEELESASDAFFDDKDIQRGANALIRFGNLTEDNFTRALAVSTDLGVRFGTVEEAATNLARAMADPARATRVLRTAGIALTKAEQKKIAALVESGDVAEAQAIILGKLEEKTRGMAKAAGGPYTDALKKLSDASEDAKKALGEAFLPVITKVADRLRTAVGDERFIAGLREFGATLASGLDSLIEIASNLPWQQIGDSLKLAGQGAKAVLGAFNAMPPWVQTAILTGWGLNKLTGGAISGIVGELAKGLVKGVLGINAGVVNINAATVSGLPGGGGPGGALPKAAPLATGLGIGAAGLGTLAAGIGAVVAMNILPYVFKGPQGSSGPTLETNTNPSFATTAVLNSLAQQMTETARNTAGTAQRVSDVSADIRNGFATQGSTIRNGFTTLTTGATQTKDAIRNGFNINATKAAALASTVRSGDERTASRISSLDAATRSGLAGVRGAANATASAIRGKRWQITVPVTVNNAVSVRAVTNGQTTVARYTGGAQTSRTIL